MLCFNDSWSDRFKMNEIVNNVLLTGAKFMPELYLRQPGFNYSACGMFTKHRERIQKLEKKQVI